MHKDHLGDSYDLVKRFFCQVLDEIVPLYADPRFVPEPISSQVQTDHGDPDSARTDESRSLRV